MFCHKSFLHRCIYTFITLLLFSWQQVANAADNFVALVINAKGTVTASTPNAKPRLLKRRSHIYNHETITASKTGSAQIRFSDGSLISIQNDSSFNISDYQYKQPGKKNKNALVLLKGGFRNVSGAIGKETPEAVSFKTPAATIGLRGTDVETIIKIREEAARVLDGMVAIQPNTAKGELLVGAEEAAILDTATMELEQTSIDDPVFDNLDVPLPSDEEINQVIEEDDAADDNGEEATAEEGDEEATTEEDDAQDVDANDEAAADEADNQETTEEAAPANEEGNSAENDHADNDESFL